MFIQHLLHNSPTLRGFRCECEVALQVTLTDTRRHTFCRTRPSGPRLMIALWSSKQCKHRQRLSSYSNRCGRENIYPQCCNGVSIRLTHSDGLNRLRGVFWKCSSSSRNIRRLKTTQESFVRQESWIIKAVCTNQLFLERIARRQSRHEKCNIIPSYLTVSNVFSFSFLFSSRHLFTSCVIFLSHIIFSCQIVFLLLI